MTGRTTDRRTRIRWGRVAAVLVLFFVSGLTAAYWMLAGLDLNRFKPEIVEAVRTATGRELTLGGDIDLRIGLHPTLAVENVRYPNAPWGSRRDMLRLKRLEFQVAAWPLLFGAVDIRRVVLVSPDLLLETRADGEWNLPRLGAEDAREPTPPGDRLQSLAFADARIEGGRLAWRSGRSGKTVRLDLKTASAGMTGFDSPVQLAVNAVFDGRPLRVAGSVGRIFQLLDERRPWPVDLSLSTRGMRAAVSGAVRSVGAGRGIDLVFRIDADRLADVSAVLPQWLSEKRQRLSASFRLTDPAMGRLRLSDLRIAVGENELSGRVAVDTLRSRTFFKADLQSPHLLLNVPPEAPSGSADSGDDDRIFSTRKIDFGFLDKVDAEIHVAVERLQLPVLETGAVDIHLVVENGEASLRPALVQIGNGYAEGRASLRQASNGAWLSLRLTARDLPAERVLTVISRPPVLTGKMDADIRLLARGNSPAELMAGLDGKLFWIMGKGSIHTRYIDTLGGEMAGSLIRLLGAGAEEEQATDLNCMVAEVEFIRGIAHCRGLLLDTERTTIVGEGEIDLATEEIDLAMDPSPKSGVGVKGLGGLTLSLGELGNPFKLGGTLASPQMTLDTAGAVITFGKVFGGFTLAGPLGLAAVLADFSSAGDNPCLEAIEAFKKKNAEKIQP